MNKIITAAAVAAALGISVAPLALHASDKVSAEVLPPTYITYQLVGEGYDLRGLEFENGAYEARLRQADGSLAKVVVDPQSGRVLPAGPADRRHADRSPTPKVSAADAIQTVAMQGHWDIVKLKHRDGAWRIAARDDTGALAKFTVDAGTGAIVAADHR